MNTYRAVLWAKIQMGSEEFFVFNSHYPLSGNSETRLKCAELEMHKIKEITKGDPWISLGDRNCIPTRDDNDVINKDSIREYFKQHNQTTTPIDANHIGIKTTWIGFLYDQFRNKIDINGEYIDDGVLDIIVSNLTATLSFHLHGAFDPKEFGLLPLLKDLDTQNTDGCYFSSDHALVGVDLNFDQLHNSSDLTIVGDNQISE